MRIRQIVFAASNLAQGRDQIAQLFGLATPFRDPGVAEFGIDNAVFALGHQFIEVISPTRPGTACGRHLDRHGDSPYMLILQTDDFAREERHLDALGVRRVWRSSHPNIHAMHLHPKDIGGAIVSIDQPLPAASWRWGGPAWQTGAPPMTETEARQCVQGVTLRAADPQALAERWAQVLGLAMPVALSAAAQVGQNGNWRLALEDGHIDFESTAAGGAGDRITEFSLSVSSMPEVLARARGMRFSTVGNSVALMGAQVGLESLATV